MVLACKFEETYIHAHIHTVTHTYTHAQGKRCGFGVQIWPTTDQSGVIEYDGEVCLCAYMHLYIFILYLYTCVCVYIYI